MIQSFKDYGAKAASVSCGSHHTVILTDDGEVLTCGIGENGRLGTGNSSDALEPLPVESLLDVNIVQVAASKNHTVALSNKGQVFTWGRNDMVNLILYIYI